MRCCAVTICSQVFKIQDNLFIGMSGLSTDVSTLCVLPPCLCAVVQPRKGKSGGREGQARVVAADSGWMGAFVQMRRCERFRFKTNLYKLREGREMKPTTFANVVAHTRRG